MRLRAPADFETQQSYRFSVTATDPHGQRTVRDVTLSITDVADTPAPPPPPPPPPPAGTPEPAPVITDREANDAAGTAQFIDRATLRVDANNASLPSNTLPSGSIQGTIGTPTDRDFFSIYLNEGEQLTLDIDGTGGLDAFVRLYSPGGAQIGFNDDSATLDPGSSTPLDSFGRWRAPTSGTYTFVVES